MSEEAQACAVHGDLCLLRHLVGWEPADCAGLMDEGLIHLKRRKGWPEYVHSATMEAPEAERELGAVIHMPEAEKTYDQERWERMRPGVPWPGTAFDLQCPEGPKVWKNYIPGKGPVIRNPQERREYMRLTGHREIERGEDFGRVEPRERLRREIRERFLRFVRKG